ncbi:hypothetical protein VLK31_32385 [Variovorax sp. H27-G14]|uniref:hypothetical protein n=1 Tax=Variovorax sp. H27-G14 TaxID=3111914 RepID=UPI0038FCF3DB
MTQLHAAYCVPEVLGGLTSSDNSVALALLRTLATFDLDTGGELPGFDGDRTELAALIAVAINLTSRGMPTRAPLALSQSVLRAAWPGYASFYAEDRRGVGFDLASVPADFQTLLVRALHVTESRLSKSAFSEVTRAHYPLDSHAEHHFLNNVVALRLGTGLAQALMPQAPLDGLLRMALRETADSSKLDRQNVKDATQQCVDFALPLPYPAGEAPSGLILEVDGPQHQEPAQRIKDDERVKAAKLANWYTDRLPVQELEDPEPWLTNLLLQADTHPYCLTLRQNYDEPLHGFDAGRRAEQLILSPVLAARVHRVLLEAVVGRICRRRLNLDPPCRLNFDPGMEAGIVEAGCA